MARPDPAIDVSVSSMKTWMPDSKLLQPVRAQARQCAGKQKRRIFNCAYRIDNIIGTKTIDDGGQGWGHPHRFPHLVTMVALSGPPPIFAFQRGEGIDRRFPIIELQFLLALSDFCFPFVGVWLSFRTNRDGGGNEVR